VIVLDGVRIGRGSIVGAGSVVTREIPDYSIAVGVPARVIGARGK
jgi:acetyltransferase-like isoleucine patch superfamily enzyme